MAIYCRVSTEDQAEARTIENQVEFAQKYCDMHNLKIYKFYLDDGVSGGMPVGERPAGHQLLADGRTRCFARVYVYRLDRLARTTLDLLRTHEQLQALGIALKSMTENFDTSTPSGKFFMTTLGGIAEIERATIAERMRLGKIRALKEGRWPGGPPPYGYRLEHKRLAVDPRQAEVVKLIFQLYTDEGMDTVAVADYLTAAGIPVGGTALQKESAARWYSSKVWNILTNSAYKGVFLYGKQKAVQDQYHLPCPAIVAADQWEQAQAKLKQNYFNAKRNSHYHYLLRGVIKCGLCGRSYCGDGSRSQGRYHYYRCTGSSSFRGKLVQKCRAKYVRADKLEQIVLGDMVEFVQGNDAVLAALQQAIIAAELGHPPTADGVEFKKALSMKERERHRLLLLFRRGIICADELELQLKTMAAEIKLLEKRQENLDNFQREAALLGQGQHSIKNISQALEHRLDNGEISLLRQLVGLLVQSIEVHTVGQQNSRQLQVRINYFF